MSPMQPKVLTPNRLDGIRPDGPAPIGLTVDRVLQALRDARPVIAAHAAETERLRYIAEPAWAAVWGTGLFWFTVPGTQGGLDVDDMDPIIEALALIGESCLSSSWCAAQILQQQWLLREFPDEFRQEVASRHPVISAAGSSFPIGTARREEGGLRASGHYRYGSNAMHAEWLFGMVHVEEADGSRTMQCIYVPAEEGTVLDTWQVDGVVGSSSHDFQFDNLFVPAHRTLAPAALGRPRPDHPNRLLRLPLLHLPPFFAAGPILGAARGVVAAYRTRLATGGPGGGAVDRALHHECLAKAETSVRLAGLGIREAARELVDGFADGHPPSETEQLALRAQAAHGVDLCRSALRSISDISGSSAHHLGNPLQRAMRDVAMLATHASINPAGIHEALGRMMLGLPADVPGPRTS